VPTEPQQVAINYSRVLARELDLHGEACAPLLLGTGLSPQEFESDARSLSLAQQLRLIHNGFKLSGDSGLGLRVGAHIHISTHGPLGFAALSAPDLRTALRVMLDYAAIRARFFRFELEESVGSLHINIVEQRELGVARVFMHEILMLVLWSLLDLALGHTAQGVVFSFAYPAPPHAARYAATYRYPVQFDARQTSLTVPVKYLSAGFATSDASNFAAAELQCRQILRDLEAQADVADEVREMVALGLGKGIDLIHVAEALRMSSRTLMRRLKEQGTTFQDILDDVRKEKAMQLLQEGLLTVEEVALALGYVEPNNFSRAFKRWFGYPPSAVRRLENA